MSQEHVSTPKAGKLSIVYLGTPEVAVEPLRYLHDNGVLVKTVITAPDRPAGRGLTHKPPPVKELALKLGLPILQPLTLRNRALIGGVTELAPDFIVVVAYGKILPPGFLSIPAYAPLNLHPSLLPKYRGPAPVNWCLINRESTTGVTIMHLNEQVDAGDIYEQFEIDVPPQTGAGDLLLALAKPGAEALLTTMHRIVEGTITRKPQDPQAATLAPMLTKEHGLLDWQRSAEALTAWVYGLDPWPGAYSFFRQKRIKILEAQPGEPSQHGNPGEILEHPDRATLLIACGAGCLAVRRLHPENSRAMSAREFIQGYRPRPGDQFTSP